MGTEHFIDEELTCHCGCGKHEMNAVFMELLESFRQEWGQKMTLVSAFRCPTHNAAVDGGPAHVLGVAVDVSVHAYTARQVHAFLKLVYSCGFVGVGEQLKGDWRGRFVHLDMLEDSPEHPRPASWTY